MPYSIISTIVLVICLGTTSSLAQSENELQPSVTNNNMYFWGDEQLENCWNHFNQNDSSGSSSDGFGEIEFPEGQVVSVDLTCTFQGEFLENLYLNSTGDAGGPQSIQIQMAFQIDSGNCNNGNECKDLTITLLKDDIQISQHIEPVNNVNNGQDYSFVWNIDVNETISTWNKSSEEPTFKIEYSAPAVNNVQCNSPIPIPGSDCTGNFRMYFSNNQENLEVKAEFPIIKSLELNPSNSEVVALSSTVFFIPFFLVIALLISVMIRENWSAVFLPEKGKQDHIESLTFYTRISDTLQTRIYDPITRLPENMRNAKSEWDEGSNLSDSRIRRYVSLSILYTAQGLPWGFTSVAFAAFLVDNGSSADDVAALFALVALPWTFKFIWGPMIDVIQIPNYGRRRPWVLFAQTGMIITLGFLLFIPDFNESLSLVTTVLFIHNLFASLQDVSVDALAVDILQPEEVGTANGFMFASKRLGIIAGGGILGLLVVPFGIKTVIAIQLPLLFLIMLMPLFLKENPGDKLFPWNEKVENKNSKNTQTSSNSDNENFVDKVKNIITAFSIKSPFIFIFICLLGEFWYFIDPIIIEIFIEDSGWTQSEYNFIMGILVVFAVMIGQLVGGFMGDLYGTRELAMIGFTLLALANAGVGLLSNFWMNKYVMILFLVIRGFIVGFAIINMIAVAMRLTYSKAGGSQFTAYMSMLNLSAVIGYKFTDYMVEIFDFVTCMYIGGAFTLISVILLVFIDPDQTDRELEGKIQDFDRDGDLGERPNYWDEGGGKTVPTS